MNTEEKIKSQILNFFKELDKGGEEATRALKENLSMDFKAHMAMNEVLGLNNYMAVYETYRRAFKNMAHEINDITICNDVATVQLVYKADSVGEFMGLPPTHKKVTMPIIEKLRIEKGKIVESWNYFDGLLGLVHQLDGEIRPKLMHVVH